MSGAIPSDYLRRLRDFAKIERDTILERLMREGHDPAVAVAEVPTVDEFVVRSLRDEMLAERGQLAEFALARLASRSASQDATEHRHNADRVEFELMRDIAVRAPSLTQAVWSLCGRLDLGENIDRGFDQGFGVGSGES